MTSVSNARVREENTCFDAETAQQTAFGLAAGGRENLRAEAFRDGDGRHAQATCAGMDEYALIRPQLCDFDQRMARRHRRKRQRGRLSIAEAARTERRSARIDDHIAGERARTDRHHRIRHCKSLDAGANGGNDARALSAKRLAIRTHGQGVHHVPEIEPARGDTDFDLARLRARDATAGSSRSPSSTPAPPASRRMGFGRILRQTRQPAGEHAACTQGAFRFAAIGQQLRYKCVRLHLRSRIRIEIDQRRVPIGMFERCGAPNSKRGRLRGIGHIGCNGGDRAARHDPEALPRDQPPPCDGSRQVPARLQGAGRRAALRDDPAMSRKLKQTTSSNEPSDPGSGH